MNDFEMAAARYISKATNNLNGALGAFVVSFKTHPGIHKRLLDLSTTADDLYLDMLEACGIDENDIGEDQP